MVHHGMAHGMYHPAKPGKIYIEKTPGPEFTKQIIGVLIKFRGEQAPLWEASRQCFSKSTFLSINEACYASCGGKATTSTNQPTDHQICVHEFGGASSPSCCN